MAGGGGGVRSQGSCDGIEGPCQEAAGGGGGYEAAGQSLLSPSATGQRVNRREGFLWAQVISKAKVPIVKFVEKESGISFDIRQGVVCPSPGKPPLLLTPPLPPCQL